VRKTNIEKAGRELGQVEAKNPACGMVVDASEPK
jgi:hypothetical protein